MNIVGAQMEVVLVEVLVVEVVLLVEVVEFVEVEVVLVVGDKVWKFAPDPSGRAKFHKPYAIWRGKHEPQVKFQEVEIKVSPVHQYGSWCVQREKCPESVPREWLVFSKTSVGPTYLLFVSVLPVRGFSRNFVLEILLDSILTTLDTFLSVRIPYTISKNDYSQYSIVILIIRLEVLTTYGSREAEAIKNFAKYCFCLFAIEFQ